jgi:hypothetical protein
VNYLSSEGPQSLRRLLGSEQVQIFSVLILFIGGEICIALGSILTARAKKRIGFGVAAALFIIISIIRDTSLFRHQKIGKCP